MPGAGKTTVAGALRRRMPGMRCVSRDVLRTELLRAPDYGEAEKRRLFAVLLERVEAHLARGEDVVLDGLTFSRAGDREALAAAAARCGGAIVLVLLDLPRAEARRRVAAGGHPAADRTPALVDEVAARFDPVGPGVLVLDATRPPVELAEAIAAAVAAIR